MRLRNKYTKHYQDHTGNFKCSKCLTKYKKEKYAGKNRYQVCKNIGFDHTDSFNSNDVKNIGQG